MRALLAVAILALAGCDGGVSTPLGDPVLDVVAGNEQTTEAPRDTLNQPVVAQLARKPAGGITFRLVKDLYAQTPVQGIAGKQVCAVGITDNPLTAWNPCEITDANGLATFYFDPPTKAGTAMAEIRAVVDGQKVVTDTAVAVVEPGPLAAWNGNTLNAAEGETVDLKVGAIRQARDEYHNPIDPADLTGLTIRWVWQPYSQPWPDTVPEDAGTGWSVTVPAGASTWGRACCSSEPDAVLVAWIDGVRNGVAFHVSQ